MKPQLSFLMLSTLFLLAPASLAQNQTLNLARSKGQTALVAIEVKISGNVERTVNEKTKKDRLKIERKLEFLDIIDRVGSSERVKHTFEGSRRYFCYELDDNGEQVDPSLAGVNLKVLLRDDGQINVEPSNKEFVEGDYINAIGPRVQGFGFGPGADLNVLADGRVENFDLRGLAPVLVAAPERVEKVEGTMRVLETDADKGLMILGGSAQFSLSRRRGSSDIGWRWDLDLRFTVDLKAQRIIGATATGTVIGEGFERDTRVNFEGKVEAEAKVDIAPNLEKELKRKIKLREVDHRVGDTGVSFQAPSTYYYNDLDGNVGYRFLSSTNGQAKVRMIGVRFTRHDSPQDVVDEESKKFRGQSNYEVDKVSMKGGKGISVAGKSQEGSHMITQETYAVKGGVITFRYDVPLSEAKEGAAELKRIRKTLRFDP